MRGSVHWRKQLLIPTRLQAPGLKNVMDQNTDLNNHSAANDASTTKIKCENLPKAKADDQQKAPKELQFANERLNLIARATNDVLWDWDLKTNHVWRTEGASETFGYPPDELSSSPEALGQPHSSTTTENGFMKEFKRSFAAAKNTGGMNIVSGARTAPTQRYWTAVM